MASYPRSKYSSAIQFQKLLLFRGDYLHYATILRGIVIFLFLYYMPFVFLFLFYYFIRHLFFTTWQPYRHCLPLSSRPFKLQQLPHLRSPLSSSISSYLLYFNFVNCCWSSPAQSFFVLVPAGPIIIFFCITTLSRQALPNFSPALHFHPIYVLTLSSFLSLI
jgi:hypothetical protein